MSKTVSFLQRRKYELLLIALVLHLFIGIMLDNLDFYARVIWPINMLMLGVASIGVFVEKGNIKNIIQRVLFVLVLILPLSLPLVKDITFFFAILNLAYVVFFSFIFLEIIRFLIKPGYINADIISASACGYFLLIEIFVFLMQFFFYQNNDSFKGVDITGRAATYMDLVYFCSITITSIGFGDILPNSHYTKLITAFFGVAGQFYSVVLVGILISKFTSATNKLSEP